MMTAHSKGPWRVTVARTLDEVEALRETWEDLQRQEPSPNIDSDIDRYISVVSSMGDAARPHVILLCRDGRPHAMLLGRLVVGTMPVRVGYKTLARPVLKKLSVMYEGLLGELSLDDSRRLLKEVEATLERGEADVAFFHQVNTDSPMHAVVHETAGIFRRDHFLAAEPHWVMTAPTSMEAFYASLSKNSRKSMRRGLRRLEKEYPDQVEHVCFSRDEQLPEMFSALGRVSSKTYQEALGAGFLREECERQQLETAAERGWLRAHLLRLAGQPVAYKMAFEYRGRYFLVATGYDAAFRRHGPGKALMLMILKELCRTGEVKEIDFGYGDSEHKRSFCDKCRWEASIALFARRPKPLLVNLSRTASEGLWRGARHAVKRFGLFHRMRRRWRDRLRRKDIGGKRR